MQTLNFKRLLLVAFSGLLLFTSCKKDSGGGNPKADAIDPGEGAGGTVITVTGKGLSGIQTITFETGNVPVAFNTNFNTDNAIIFRVPNGANVGDQDIIFVNTEGTEFRLEFKVLALVSVSSAYPLEFEQGNRITLTGNYFETVDDVTLEGTTDKATIISQTATDLVLQMPATSVKSARLLIHNNAGTRATTMVFVNMAQQFRLFTEGLPAYVQNWSWCAASPSTNFAVSGTQSFEAKYSMGGNQGLSFRTDNPMVLSNYTHLVFWVKGGTVNTTIDIKPDAIATGTPSQLLDQVVPANVWTYFKIPVAGNWGGSSFQRFNIQMDGPTGSDQTIYFDNVYLLTP